jgi:magnesium-transporting ATPase (P-type)
VDQVVADGIFISGSTLKTDEAAITGESDAVAKDAVKDPFLLSGTSICSGACNMLVTSVGETWIEVELPDASKKRLAHKP